MYGIHELFKEKLIVNIKSCIPCFSIFIVPLKTYQKTYSSFDGENFGLNVLPTVPKSFLRPQISKLVVLASD